METEQRYNSTELRNGDELRFKLANKEFPDEWTIIAARESREAAERANILAQAAGLDYSSRPAPAEKPPTPEELIPWYSITTNGYRAEEVTLRNANL